MTAHNSSLIVGYSVEPDSQHKTKFVGTAEINGEVIEHVVTMCAQPHEPIDVGRNEDGDVVWVSHNRAEEKTFPELSGTPALQMTFDPPKLESEFEVEVPKIRESFLRNVAEKLSQRRLVVITSSVVGVIVVFVGLVMTSTPMKMQVPRSESVPVSTQSPQPSESGLMMEPTEAAIDFVLGGQVAGLTVPADVSRESLRAIVVSTSGEIVLVEVQSEQQEGLTTFATLLLQKSGTAWRIREVFDPR